MSEVQVKVINRSRHPLPRYQTAHAAAADAHANIDQPITLQPLERALIPTGIYFALPQGYEMQVRPRSGLAVKHGISIVNSPGTIDADFRGELAVIMINMGQEPFVVNDGDRIAQILVSKYDQIAWQEVAELDQTERGEGAYGHTGK